jgi:RNA polymerase sigma-70 factor (ECF subfamily)
VTPDARAQIRTLLERLADGDRGAVEPAFDALWPLVRQFCARAVPVAADAEDAAPQAIVRAFDRIADYDRRRDALAWVLTIASYEVLTLRSRARRRREQSFDAAHDVAGPGEDAEERLAQQDLQAAVREVLAGLRPEDAAVLAAAMGLPGPSVDRAAMRPATFRKRLQRALERFRVAWRTKHGSA